MGLWQKIMKLFSLTPELKLGENTEKNKQTEEPKEVE